MEMDDRTILGAWDKIVELNYEFRVLLDETLCRFHTREEILVTGHSQKICTDLF